jgi:hypothetical protein
VNVKRRRELASHPISWVAKAPVKQTLKDLDNLLKSHREGRNLYVHRGSLPDIATVMGDDELDLLKAMSFVQGVSQPFIDRKIMDLGYREHVQKICKALQKERNKIDDVIWKLFDSLLPIYDKKASALHQKWKIILEKELERRKSKK